MSSGPAQQRGAKVFLASSACFPHGFRKNKEERRTGQRRASSLSKPHHLHHSTLSTVKSGHQNGRWQEQRENPAHLCGSESMGRHLLQELVCLSPPLLVRELPQNESTSSRAQHHLTRQRDTISELGVCAEAIHAWVHRYVSMCVYMCTHMYTYNTSLETQNPEKSKATLNSEEVQPEEGIGPRGVKRGREEMRFCKTKSKSRSLAGLWHTHLHSLNICGVLLGVHLNIFGNPIPFRSLSRLYSRKDALSLDVFCLNAYLPPNSLGFYLKRLILLEQLC